MISDALIESLEKYPAPGWNDSFHAMGWSPQTHDTEFAAQAIARYANSLHRADLTNFKTACGLVVRSLDLTKPAHLSVAIDLMHVALITSAFSVLPALASVPWPHPANPEFFRLVIFAERIAFRAAEIERSRGAAAFLNRVINSMDYRRASSAGLFLVALTAVEPQDLRVHFAKLRASLKDLYREQGGEWIVTDLRALGVDEGLLHRPSRQTPAWWSRMVEQSK